MAKSIEEVKDFYNNYKNYEVGNKAILNDLKSYKKLFQRYQKDPDNNFVNDDPEKMEGSTVYRNMTLALKTAISKFENPDTKPSELKMALKMLYDTAHDYYDDKNALAVIAGDQKGYARFALAKSLMSNVPMYANVFDNNRKRFVGTKSKNISDYSLASLSEIKNRAKHLVDKYEDELEDEKDWKSKPSPEDMKQLANYQTDFMKKMKKVSKTLVSKYNPAKGVDYYLTIKKKMSIEEKAKYYLGKKYIDKMYVPRIYKNKAEELYNSFSASNFKNEYMALSQNPYFKDCMAKNPKDGFSKWEEFEANVDRTINEFKEDSIDLGMERYAVNIFGTSSISRPIFGKVNGQTMEQRQISMIQKMANAMTLDIVQDKNTRDIARELTVNPQNKEKLTETIKEFISSKNLFAHKDSGKIILEANHMMENTEVNKQISANFFKKLQLERNAEKAKAKQKAPSKKSKGM